MVDGKEPKDRLTHQAPRFIFWIELVGWDEMRRLFVRIDVRKFTTAVLTPVGPWYAAHTRLLRARSSEWEYIGAIPETDPCLVDVYALTGRIRFITYALWWVVWVRAVTEFRCPPSTKTAIAGCTILWLLSRPNFSVVGNPVAAAAALAINRGVPARISVREWSIGLDTRHPHLVWTVPNVPIVVTGMLIWFTALRATCILG
jgi:hypothetical protein